MPPTSLYLYPPTQLSLTFKALKTTPAAMNRIFGAKNTAPKPTLQGAIGNVSPLGLDFKLREKIPYVLDLLIVSSLQLESRVESIDVQLSKLNAELATYQQRLSKMRDGPGKNAIKQKVYIPLHPFTTTGPWPF